MTGHRAGARYAGEERRTIDYLARLLASHTGRPADDYQLELVAFMLAAVISPPPADG